MPSDGSRSPLRNETEAERYDRNFSELLQELRVVQTGAQLLFAFLLTVAFSNRFAAETERVRGVYVATLLLTTLATGLLIAPAAYHRHHFRRGLKGEVVQVGHLLAQAGIATLALAIASAVLLVMLVVVETWLAWGLAVATLVMLASLWFAVPTLRRARGVDQTAGEEQR